VAVTGKTSCSLSIGCAGVSVGSWNKVDVKCNPSRRDVAQDERRY